MVFEKKSSKIKSDYPNREEIDYANVPKHFKSVTDKSLHEIKNYCAASIRRRYNGEYSPNTLQAMLQTIDGEFEQAYSLLEADYSSRLSNLKQAYQDGLSDIEHEINLFRNDVNDHDDAFRDYDEVHQGLIGRKLDQKLLYAHRLEELEAKYKKLQEK